MFKTSRFEVEPTKQNPKKSKGKERRGGGLLVVSSFHIVVRGP